MIKSKMKSNAYILPKPGITVPYGGVTIRQAEIISFLIDETAADLDGFVMLSDEEYKRFWIANRAMIMGLLNTPWGGGPGNDHGHRPDAFWRYEGHTHPCKEIHHGCRKEFEYLRDNGLLFPGEEKKAESLLSNCKQRGYRCP